MAVELTSGDALLAFDDDLTIQAWNRAAEELTGIPADEAVGRPCWAVLGGVDDRGSLVCHAGCSDARLAAKGWPVHSKRLCIKPGIKTWVSTITVRNGGAPLYVHVLRPGEEPRPEAAPEPKRRTRLTPRQLEVLHLIDDGLPAKAIAARLGIAEPTVRNHIRSILLELGCHSQVGALALARQRGLL